MGGSDDSEGGRPVAAPGERPPTGAKRPPPVGKRPPAVGEAGRTAPGTSPRGDLSPPGSVPPPTNPARRAGGFLRDLWERLAEGDIFFMAGAIAFNILVAVIPLFLLGVGIAGLVLTARFGESTEVIMNFLLDTLPVVEGDVELVANVEGVVRQLLAERASFTVVGALFFIWISTRLIGTLRTVLKNVFQVPVERGMVQGKLFDAQIVVIAGMLMTINLGITIAVGAFQTYGMDLLGLEDRGIARMAESIVGDLLAFLSVWTLFLLIYRYLPRRLTPWRTSVIAATVTALFFEAVKFLFGWYATEMADFRSAYGSLTTVAILFFWIYYGSVVFIFGGYVAQVYTVRREERLRWEEWMERPSGRGGSAGRGAG